MRALLLLLTLFSPIGFAEVMDRNDPDRRSSAECNGIWYLYVTHPRNGIALQINKSITLTDGKLLLAGQFGFKNGKGDQRHLVRLNADGSIDCSFNAGGIGFDLSDEHYVSDIVQTADGKMLVAGRFSTYNAQEIPNLIRLNHDGSLDTSFDLSSLLHNPSWRGVKTYADSPIGLGAVSLLQRTDGRIVVGGYIGSSGFAHGSTLMQLMPDGTLDPSFEQNWIERDTLRGWFLPTIALVGMDSDQRIYFTGGLERYPNYGIYRLQRFNSDGSQDKTYVKNADLPQVSAMHVSPAGEVWLGGNIDLGRSRGYTSVAGTVVKLDPTGAFDNSFKQDLYLQTPGRGSESPQGWLSSLAISPSGRIVVGGQFQYETQHIVNSDILFLNHDGTVDEEMIQRLGSTGQANGEVMYLAIDEQNRLLVGGHFSHIWGRKIRYGLGRFELDTSDENLAFADNVRTYHGPIAQLGDGNILAVGDADTFNGEKRQVIVRLNADGHFEKALLPSGSGFEGTIESIVVQNDGRILAAGKFSQHIVGQGHHGIIRLENDGSVDSSFVGDIDPKGGVYNLVVQPDQKILLGGDFGSVNNQEKWNLARLNPDGTIDSSFNVDGKGLDSGVWSLVLADDLSIWVGGGFVQYNEQDDVGSMVHLSPDGALDRDFRTNWRGIYQRVSAILPTPDHGAWGYTLDRLYASESTFFCFDPTGNAASDCSIKSGNSKGARINKVFRDTQNNIYACGAYDNSNVPATTGMIRFLSDGSPDPSFRLNFDQLNVYGRSSEISGCQVDINGEVLIWGNFVGEESKSFTGILKLKQDGSFDSSFNNVLLERVTFDRSRDP